jgi:glutathione synthase/RimK-type ligase-like ATP-grasp enzyme
LYVDEHAIRLDRLAPDADLYLLASHSPLALSLATGLETLGARVLNRASATLLARDALRTATVLARAGLPIPQVLVAARPEPLARELAGGPLVLRHGGGASGSGTAIRSASDLPPSDGGPRLLVAHRVPPTAPTRRVSVVGDEVFGAGVSGGERWDLPELARRCGRALELELYAVEVAETDSGPVVLAVDPLPDLAGVPDAARRVAEYVTRAGTGAGTLRPAP